MVITRDGKYCLASDIDENGKPKNDFIKPIEILATDIHIGTGCNNGVLWSRDGLWGVCDRNGMPRNGLVYGPVVIEFPKPPTLVPWDCRADIPMSG